MTVLKQVQARLETAMEPYKPKPGKRKIKNDPEHTLNRQAHKKRTPSDKAVDKRKDKLYYKKNRNQLLERHKRSRELHKSSTASKVIQHALARLTASD